MFFPRCLILGAVLIAAETRTQATIIAGDLQNPLNVIGRLPEDYGWAQQLTLASGTWNVTAAEAYVGNQFPGFPAVPVIQIRNSLGNIPGNSILGTFTMNPDNIPAWESGVNHLAAVSAPADSTVIIGAGTYWLCLMNFAAPGSQGVIDVGFADASPMQQSGSAGNLINVASLATWDAGTFSSFTPEIANQTLLVQLDSQPVPEPSTAMLAGLGAISLLALLRRSKIIQPGVGAKRLQMPQRG